ncbi:hypothetical protein ALO48_200072 [Pseudomonas syringae pv. rhaphiolepidis]|nr:hypothetical protein ALO48_200072 [Pseudomonas syringae pv. rhaphiolepidis]
MTCRCFGSSEAANDLIAENQALLADPAWAIKFHEGQPGMAGYDAGH